MSDWEVDGVADNTWSSLDEVAWIECESKGNHIAAEPGVLRGSSCKSPEPFQRVAGGALEFGHRVPDETHQRLITSDACLKTEALEELASQEFGYSPKDRTVPPSKGGWYDSTAGGSTSALLLNALDNSSSALKVGTEKESFKYGFEGAEMCKSESSYQEDGADIVNSPCHFLLSDIYAPGGDFEFLAEAQEEVRRENLLEFGWGNTNQLEDIDNLFSGNESILSRGYDNNPGMLWEPPSPTLGDSLASLHQPANMPVSPEFVSRGVTKGVEAKPDLGTTSKTLSKQERVLVSGEWKGSPVASKLDSSCLPMQVESYADCSNGNNWEGQGASERWNRGAECMDNEGLHVMNESNKVSKLMQFGSTQVVDSTPAVKESEKLKTSKGRRHGSRPKRLEDTSRKPVASHQKVALNLSQTNSPSYLYVPVVPIAHESPPPPAQVSRVSSCEPISPMQCLQPVPYVHAGFGFPAHHHLPVVVQTTPVIPQQLQPQAQPVFISYQPPFVDVAKVQPSKGTFDVSSQSPTASSTMTPQEKIEKLRWRQKMQARLAVEQQQQQLINQRFIPEQAQFGGRPINCQLNSYEEVLGGSVRVDHSQCTEPLNWNERSLSVERTMLEDGDESLAAAVLHQLLNIASKMDTRTRLCLRDGFCRLARNAMQRRAAGDNRYSERNSPELMHRSCTAESSSSSDQPCSQRLLTVDDIVETETNPMDRFIAHLLFHKRFPSPYTPVNMNYTPPPNNSKISEPSPLQQNGWVWSEDNKVSHLSPATRSSSVTGGEGAVSKEVNVIPEIPTSDAVCEKTSMRSPCFSQPKVSGPQLENVISFSTVSADNPLQNPAAREIGMSNLDQSDVPSTSNMEISGDVTEPLLQAK